MPLFPQTAEGLIEQGYVFSGKGTCRGCGAAIDWWQTPSGGTMPIDADLQNSHFATCPKAKDFKRGRKDAAQKK